MSERVPFVQIDTSGAPAIDAVADGDTLVATDKGLLIAGKDGDSKAQFIKTETDGSVAVSDNGTTLSVDDGGGSLTVDGSVSITGTPSVAVSNFPSTQAITGTITANIGTAGALALDATLTGGTQQSRITDGTNVAAVKAASTAAVAADKALVVAISPNGTLKVDGSATTQPVSGSVSVSNFPATQPVSAASLPLPTGAATSAKQPALGTAGAASADVISVQGVASMTALKVDGSGATQPVSGSVSVSNFPSTQPISAAALPLPSGAATAAKQPALGTAGAPATDVMTVQGAASMTALKVDGSGATQPISASALPLPSGAATSAKQDTGNTSLGSIDTKTPALVSGKVPVDVGTPSVSVSNFPATQPVSGSVSVSNFPSTQPVSATALPLPAGASTETTLSALNTKINSQGQKAMAASTPVVLASDQSAVPVSGTMTVTGVATETTLAALNTKVPAQGQAAMAASQPVAIASNQTAIPVTDNSGSLTVDSTQLPAALVGGRLTVDGSGVTQPVSGSVTATISGTPNVAVTSSTLPTGASTAAKQPALGAAGTASTDVLTVQGIASMTALKVDGSAVTQPVSGTVTANLGTVGTTLALDATLTGGTQKAINRGGAKGTTVAADVTSTAEGANNQALDVQLYHGGTAINPTQIRALTSSDQVTIVPSGTQAVSGTVTANLGTIAGVSTAAKQPALGIAGTASTDVLTVQGIASMTALKVDGSAVTQPVSGTVTANLGTVGTTLALDATLTGGTQKAITRGGAKGTTVATDVTSTAEGANNQALDVQLYHGGAAINPTQIRALTSSDQVTVVPSGTQTVSGTVTANLGTVGTTLALDATLTGGTQKAIARGGAKGTTVATDVTSTASGANHQPLDVAIFDASGNQIGTASNPLRVDTTNNTAQAVTGTVTANAIQSTAAALTGAWPVKITDGTNTMPTADTVARASFHRITDGTNTATVKPATTPAVAGDQALVVVVSPNNSVAVTAASLPLPTGAATSAALTTLGSTTTKINDGTNTAAVKAASTPALATDPALVVATIAPPSAALTNVSTSTTSTTLLSANTARRAASIVNDSTAILYIKFGATATSTSYTVALAPSVSGVPSYYEVLQGYTGQIDAVLSTGTGTARITALS